MSNDSNLTSSVVGINGVQVTTFYIPWDYTNYPYYYQDGDSTWSDGSESTVTSFSTMAKNVRSTFAVSSVTTPNGDTLDNYSVLDMYPQVYTQSDWNTPRWQVEAGGYGTRAGIFGVTETIYVVTGSLGLFDQDGLQGGSMITSTGFNTASPVRIKIVCSK